jgi:hypothetical protein
VVNWLVIRSTLHHFFGRKAVKGIRVAVQGDDSVVGYPWFDDRIPSNEEFLAEAKRMWGMLSGEPDSGVVTEGMPTSAWLEMCPSFLKVRNYLGLPSWGLRDLLFTELGYKKGKEHPQAALAEWGGFWSYATFGAEVNDHFDRYGQWLYDALPHKTMKVNYHRELSEFRFRMMALLHSEIYSKGMLGETGMFEIKGRTFREWSYDRRKAAIDAKDPYTQERELQRPGRLNYLLTNIAVYPNGHRFKFRCFKRTRPTDEEVRLRPRRAAATRDLQGENVYGLHKPIVTDGQIKVGSIPTRPARSLARREPLLPFYPGHKRLKHEHPVLGGVYKNKLRVVTNRSWLKRNTGDYNSTKTGVPISAGAQPLVTQW